MARTNTRQDAFEDFGSADKDQLTREHLHKSIFTGSDGKERLEYKTEIKNVVAMAVLDTWAIWANPSSKDARDQLSALGIDPHKMNQGDMLALLAERYRRNAVSHGRGARMEFVEALKTMTETQESSRLQRLFKAVGV